MKWIGDEMTGAVFSPCRTWRYTLWRRFTPDALVKEMCCFIGLNPSTADETQDDPTIRRCIQFSKDWGYKGYVMLNLFAYRATDPRVMKAAADPFGESNTEAMFEVSMMAGRVVAAWGNHGQFRGQSVRIKRMLPKSTVHLGLTKSGEPKHPLYLLASTVPQKWNHE